MSFWPVVDGANLCIKANEWWLINHQRGIALWRDVDGGDQCRISAKGQVMASTGAVASDKEWDDRVTALQVTPEQAQKLVDVARHMHEPQWRAYIQRIWTELVDEAQRNA